MAVGQNALDRRQQNVVNDPTIASTRGTEEQKILLTDIISEGPIAGLIDGGTSVYLNDDALQSVDQAAYSAPVGATVALTSGQTSVTVDPKGNSFNVRMGTVGKKYLVVHNAYELSVTAGTITTLFSHGGMFVIPLGGRVVVTKTAGTSLDDAWNHPNAVLTKWRNVSWKISEGSVQATLWVNKVKPIKGVLDSINESNQTANFTFRGRTGNQLFWNNLDDGSTVHTLKLDLFLEISAIDGTTLTLANAAPLSITTGFSITSSLQDDTTGANGGNQDNAEEKYEGAGFHFTNGDVFQEALPTLNGVGSNVSPITVPSGSLQENVVKTITHSGGQASLIDEVKLLIKYSNGLYTNNEKKGKKQAAAAAYKIELSVDRGDGDNFQILKGNATYENETCFAHGGTYKKAVVFEIRLNLEQYQPYTGFKIRITRLTKHDYEDTSPQGAITYPGLEYDREPKNKMIAEAVISGCFGLIKEKLNFPYTAHANVSFSSKQFQSLPARTYDCQGLRVKVPSNYITREENNGDTALYRRNVTTGAKETTNQFWNGAFRTEKVYTNNPAWVFYDIVTNNRYGLGDFMKETDIDKYSLYNIAKYCDELVPDGKGGQEPRFTANLYLQKATDCYKVLKDMATIFRGMIYWADSQFFAVTDEKRQPIYNFSRSNVTDGRFNYEGTGDKTRVNQVIVTWNNPEADYKQEPLVVEDRENQIKTGKIKSLKSMAFGCTSPGQATRYGRWKIWTSINQTEIINFESGLNASFLSPGDIVNVQDDADLGIAFSGRVHTCTNSAITIDRDIASDFSGGYTYTLSVILPKRTIILNQDAATVNISGSTENLTRGQIVTTANTIAGSTTTLTTLLNADEEVTQRNVASAVDSSGNLLDLQYETSSIVEERTLTTGGTTTSEGRNTIPISAAFSETPATGAVWAIKQVPTGGTTATEASYKQYKILTIGESNKNKVGITAVEYYPIKFDSIDAEFRLDTPDPLYPPENTVEVPAPKNLAILREPDPDLPGEELTLAWDPPDPVGSTGVSETYEYLAEYEVTHGFGDETGFSSSFRVPSTQRSVRFTNVPNGIHKAAVQTISGKGRFSKKAVATIDIKDLFGGEDSRKNGIIKGAICSEDVEMIQDGADKGKLKFQSTSYVILPRTLDDIAAKRNTEADADSYTLSCTALANSSWPVQASGTSQDTGYVFYDFSKADLSNPNANPLKLVVYKEDAALSTANERIGYWYDGDKYITSASSIWTSLGTCSVELGSRKVVGTGFSSGVKIPEVVKIGTAFAGKVAYVESNTILWLDRPWPNANATSQAISVQELDIDYNNDFLVCTVTYDATALSGAGQYYMGTGTIGGPSFLTINPNLESVGRSLLISSNVNVINYESDSTQVTTFSDISVTVDCIGFKNPQVKVTGTGFNSLSEDPDSDYVTVSNNTRVVELHDNGTLGYNAAALDFTVAVREKEDSSNTDKQLSKTFSIVKVKDGSIGTQGKTVDLVSTDWTVIFTADGARSHYTGTGGVGSGPIRFTATARNFTAPLYRINRKSGSTDNWLTGDSGTNYWAAEGTNTADYNVPSSSTQGSFVIEVEVAEKPSGSSWPAANTSDVEASDSANLVFIQNGVGGLQMFFDNPNHAVSCNSAGLPTGSAWSNSGTKIEFFANGAEVAYNQSGGNKTWRITGVAATGNGWINGNGAVGSGDDATKWVQPNHDWSAPGGSSQMALTEIITYTGVYTDGFGEDHTIKGTQNLFKSIAGGDGVSPAAPDAPPAYAAFTIYLHTETLSTEDVPSKPTGDPLQYTFSTGAPFAVGHSGWALSMPTGGFKAHNSSNQPLTWYAASVRATANASGGDTSSGTNLVISTPHPIHNFDGVVTFTDLAGAPGGSNSITAIHGSHITTGTIAGKGYNKTTDGGAGAQLVLDTASLSNASDAVFDITSGTNSKFKVTKGGDLTMTGTLSASNFTGGNTIDGTSGSLTIGSTSGGSVVLDGPNQQITIKDSGNNVRVKIGKF